LIDLRCRRYPSVKGKRSRYHERIET